MKITNRSCPFLLVTALTRTATVCFVSSSYHHQGNAAKRRRSAMVANVVADMEINEENHQLGNEYVSIILPDASTVSLDDMSPRSYFAPSANCFENDEPISCPDSTIATKTDARTGFRIIASQNKQNGQLSSIAVRDTTNGHRVPIQSVSNNRINPNDGERHSSSTLTEKITSSVNENVRRYLQKEQQMELQGARSGSISTSSDSPCTSYREIELAVVAESSFCQAVGGPTNVDMVVDTIIANVASEYEINSLCFTIVITHYEKHCDSSNDPYKAGVDLNVSGCGLNSNSEYGLLDHFEDFWNANRSSVHRDIAELFTGTPLECGPCNLGANDPNNNKSCCTVGCSRPKKSCSNLENSYGVSWVTYSSSHVARSNLVAHEIAHTLGAAHNRGSTDYLMHPANCGNDKYFSQTSIESFLDPRNDACITQASGTLEAPSLMPPLTEPSTEPSASPSASPIAPSAAPTACIAATVPVQCRNNKTTSACDHVLNEDICGSGLDDSSAAARKEEFADPTTLFSSRRSADLFSE